MNAMNRPALIIILISLPIFIGALDLTVVSAVLPHVVYDLEIPLQTGLDDAAWVVSGYLLAYTVAMTFMGRLSDLIGRRKVYLLALAIFAAGSYLVAVADTWPTQLALRAYFLVASGRPDPAYASLAMLVAARMIQAFGGGAMVPVGMALAGDLYPPGPRARILGVIAAVDTAGWVVGHLYGGILTRFFDWRMIFWLNLPVCALAFGLIYFALAKPPPGLPHPKNTDGGGETPSQPPQSEEHGWGRGKMDWPGALLIALSLIALNIGLGSNSETTYGTLDTQKGIAWSSYALPMLAAAAALFGLFIWRQARAASPLISLALFRRVNFSAASLANFLVGFSLFVAIANVPLFINTLVAETLEQGAWDSGWMLSALTVPMALASIPGGWMSSRWGYRLPAVTGVLAGVAGFVMMTTWRAATPYGTMIPHLALAGVGFGLTMAPIAAAVINAAPSEYRGSASALVIIFRLVGMTVGVSSMATYGLQRADVLSRQWLGAAADLAETIRVGMAVAEKVIQETFIIAAIVCSLALIPVLWLNTNSQDRRTS